MHVEKYEKVSIRETEAGRFFFLNNVYIHGEERVSNNYFQNTSSHLQFCVLTALSLLLSCSRTDCRGVNLNRIYSKPSFTFHPPIYAARKLLRYAHFGQEVPESSAEEGTAAAPEAASGGTDRGDESEKASATPVKSSNNSSSTSSLSSTFRVLRSSLESEVATNTCTILLEDINGPPAVSFFPSISSILFLTQRNSPIFPLFYF